MSLQRPDGYLAVPEGGKGPGILVLHAWWGLNETTRAFCNRLADSGFVVFAPDLYHGRLTADIAEAETFARLLDANADQVQAEIDRAVEFILERSESLASSVAIIGFSLGAFYALDASTRLPELVSSVVIYYGTGPADFARSQAAYLGHFGNNDPYEPAESIEWIKAALRDAGRPFTVNMYSGAGHWFAEADRPDAYNQEAAKLAWDRTITFLRETSK